MQVEVFGPSAAMERVGAAIDRLDGVSRVTRTEGMRSGHSVIAASVRPAAVDPLLDELRRLDVPESDFTVLRLDTIERTPGRRPKTTLVWADMLGQARINASLYPQYLVLIFIAGVIGGYGVLDRNAILIVGAMAVSPDLLPITAMAVGLFRRSWRLTGKAFRTVALGMAVVAAAAALIAFVQDRLDLIPSGFTLSSASDALGGLTSINHETIIVAFVAGVAGILTLETRASAAVGVAVSVTTIPAAAYLGVAAGLGEAGTAAGALGLLGVNVAMVMLGAAGTLLVQRRIRRRARGAASPAQAP